MQQASTTFRFICSIAVSFLVLLVSTPLASLALLPQIPATAAVAPVQDTAPAKPAGQPPPPAAPQVCIINEDGTLDAPAGRPVFDSLTVNERETKHLATALPPPTLYYGKKVVYLTFDDGPNPDNTPVVLEILRQQAIKATFFMIGTQVEKYPSLVKRVYQEGHAIGNHSYNHVYRDLYRSPGTYIAQLHQTDELLKNILGVRPRISRAPGGTVGSFTKAYWAVLKTEGYIDIGWNISSGDASSGKAADLIENVAYQLQNKALWDHVIVLMHDGQGHGETVKALPQIIKLFKDRGFEFRVVNTETPPAW